MLLKRELGHVIDNTHVFLRSLKSDNADLEEKLLSASKELVVQAEEVPKVTTNNISTVIDAIYAEIEKLFDNPDKAAEALKLLTELTKEEAETELQRDCPVVDHSHLHVASHAKVWEDKRRQYEEQLEEARRSSTHEDDSARIIQILHGKAICEQRAGQNEQALRDIDQVFSLNPNLVETITALITQAKSHKALGDPKLAEEALLRAKQLQEDCQDKHHLDEIYYELEHLEDIVQSSSAVSLFLPPPLIKIIFP